MGRSSFLAVGVCLISSLFVVGASADEACASNSNDLKSSCIPSSKLVKDSSLLSTKTQLLKKGTSETDVAKHSDVEAPSAEATDDCPPMCTGDWPGPELTCVLMRRNCKTCQVCQDLRAAMTQADLKVLAALEEEEEKEEADVSKNVDQEAQPPPSTTQYVWTRKAVTCETLNPICQIEAIACNNPMGRNLCKTCVTCPSSLLETDKADRAKNVDQEAQPPASTTEFVWTRRVQTCKDDFKSLCAIQAIACGNPMGRSLCKDCVECPSLLETDKVHTKTLKGKKVTALETDEADKASAHP